MTRASSRTRTSASPPTRPGQEPPANVDYTGVLSGHLAGRAGVVTALMVVLLGYLLISSLIFQLGAQLAWVVRGRPGQFPDFYTQAMGYGWVEGVAIVNLGIAMAIPITLAVYRWLDHRPPRWLMSVQPGMRWRYLIGCLVAGALVLNGIYLLAHLGQGLPYNPPRRAWLWVLLVVLTSPLQAAGEEFLFRGYLLQSFGALLRNRWLALGGSALLFALVHGQQNIWLFVDRLGFGLLAGALVLWTGGLEAGIGLHVANNVSSFCYAIAAGTMVQTRQVQYADARTVLLDLAGYAIAGALAWGLGRRMRVAVRTP